MPRPVNIATVDQREPEPRGDVDGSSSRRPMSPRSRLALGTSLAVLCASCLLSLFVGSGDIGPAAVIRALTGEASGTQELLVRDFRVPRTLLGVLAGMGLALAGVVMQALTRNPLADPGLLGVNAGAYLSIVVGTAFFGATVSGGQIAWGIAGAAASAAAVYAVASTGVTAGTPVKLVLAGVAIGAVLSGLGQAIVLADPEVFDRIRFWSVGSLQGRQMDTVASVWFVIALASVAVFLSTRSLNALTMGEEVARSLGTHVLLVRVVGFVSVTVLCGAATAAVGPVSFLGLAVPFIARFLLGVDHRVIVPFCAVAGPSLLLLADVLGRVIVPSELPAGVVTAFVGAPILVVLVRRSTLRSL
ncbi:MAG: iron chelate uptake ABC transporter family permease subunit [Ornithinimicrobium sp.]